MGWQARTALSAFSAFLLQSTLFVHSAEGGACRDGVGGRRARG